MSAQNLVVYQQLEFRCCTADLVEQLNIEDFSSCHSSVPAIMGTAVIYAE